MSVGQSTGDGSDVGVTDASGICNHDITFSHINFKSPLNIRDADCNNVNILVDHDTFVNLATGDSKGA